MPVPDDIFAYRCARGRPPHHAKPPQPLTWRYQNRRPRTNRPNPQLVILTEGDTLIAASSPPSENNEAFLAVQKLLHQAGLTVPTLLASDLDSGFFLMEDFGDVLLSARLTADTVDHLYAQALGELGRLARLPCGDVDLPVFDAQRITDELSVFPEWFLQNHLGLAEADLPSAIWQEMLALFVSVFTEQSQCVVHRDFHSRNIMCLDDGRLGIIDFQDAVLGPVTYDPVSLLKDCYVRWPRDDQLRWLDAYREQLARRGSTSPPMHNPSRASLIWWGCNGICA